VLGSEAGVKELEESRIGRNTVSEVRCVAQDKSGLDAGMGGEGKIGAPGEAGFARGVAEGEGGQRAFTEINQGMGCEERFGC